MKKQISLFEETVEVKKPNTEFLNKPKEKPIPKKYYQPKIDINDRNLYWTEFEIEYGKYKNKIKIITTKQKTYKDLLEKIEKEYKYKEVKIISLIEEKIIGIQNE